MTSLRQQVAAVTGIVSLVGLTAAVAAQAPPKMVAPVRGEAHVDITKPDTKLVKGEVVTTIRVRNMASAPIAGFKVEENWYDKGGAPVGGDVYRHQRPFQPGEVIVVTLKTPKLPALNRNQYQFSHANGVIKTKVVPKLDAPKT